LRPRGSRLKGRSAQRREAKCSFNRAAVIGSPLSGAEQEAFREFVVDAGAENMVAQVEAGALRVEAVGAESRIVPDRKAYSQFNKGIRP
jgi:hypothetical protein